MALLTPPPAAPQRGDRSTFANRVDAFITWLINFVSELLNLVTNLNSIAAGGAYAIPYVWGGGINSGSGQQSAAQAIAMANTAANGASVLRLLQQFDASSGAVKGQIKITALGDPSRWLIFNINSRSDGGTYQGFNGVVVDASSANPFNTNDTVIVQFTRNGDKGDTGQALTFLMRDQKASGTSGQSMTSNTWNQRVINTASVNNIPGASLSNNAFTLPAGVYLIDGTAPVATPNTQHQIRLYSVTDSTSYDVGTSEYTGNSGASPVTRSTLRTYISLSSAKNFRIDHYVSSNVTTVSGGAQVSAGQAEFYTEIRITKVG